MFVRVLDLYRFSTGCYRFFLQALYQMGIVTNLGNYIFCLGRPFPEPKKLGENHVKHKDNRKMLKQIEGPLKSRGKWQCSYGFMVRDARQYRFVYIHMHMTTHVDLQLNYIRSGLSLVDALVQVVYVLA